MNERIIKTPCGLIKGTAARINGITAYKGIRYATAGRFEYPREVTTWDGVYDATKYGACSYQPRSFINEEDLPKKIFYYNEFRKGEIYTYSEDCLFLNVFTPDEGGKKLPVIVYIHGGGFIGGCGHEKHFDCPIWPKNGVIGVTLNYRLGPLGFAVLPELKDEAGRTGNYGLYDQLTAILWVKHNIAAFGGDPDNITIMGQSAGAMSVQQHCLSPLSKGNFHKAVMSSGGGVSKALSSSLPEKNYDFWHTIMEKCGASTLAEFRAVPVEKLFAVWQENKKMTMGGGCAPVIDGELVVAKGYESLVRGEQAHIPYMLGTTSHDVIPPLLYSMSKKWCSLQKTPAYLWFFERNLPGDDHGAWHSSDLWYWFGTLDNCWRPMEQKDRMLSEEMTSRLCAFAKSGEPNTSSFGGWSANAKEPMTFGDKDTETASPSILKLWVTMFTNKAPGE